MSGNSRQALKNPDSKSATIRNKVASDGIARARLSAVRSSILALSIIALSASSAVAQPGQTEPLRPSPLAADKADQLERSGNTRMKVGVVVGLVGTASLIGGTLLIQRGQRAAEAEDAELLEGTGDMIGGMMLVSAGGVALIGGLIAYSSGRVRVDKANKLRTTVSLAPTRGGVVGGISGSF